MSTFSLLPTLSISQKDELKRFLLNILESDELESTMSVSEADGKVWLYVDGVAKKLQLGRGYNWEESTSTLFMGRRSSNVVYSRRLGAVMSLFQLVDETEQLKTLAAAKIVKHLIAEHNTMRAALTSSSPEAEGLAFSEDKVAALVGGKWVLPSGEEIDVSGSDGVVWTVCANTIPVAKVPEGYVPMAHEFPIGARVTYSSQSLRDDYSPGVVEREDGGYIRVRYDRESEWGDLTGRFTPDQLVLESAVSVPVFPVGARVQYVETNGVVQPGIGSVLRIAPDGLVRVDWGASIGAAFYSASQLRLASEVPVVAPATFNVGDRVRLIGSVYDGQIGVIQSVESGLYRIRTDEGGTATRRADTLELVEAVGVVPTTVPVTPSDFQVGQRVMWSGQEATVVDPSTVGATGRDPVAHRIFIRRDDGMEFSPRIEEVTLVAPVVPGRPFQTGDRVRWVNSSFAPHGTEGVVEGDFNRTNPDRTPIRVNTGVDYNPLNTELTLVTPATVPEFNQGDRVQVIGGANSGRSGVIEDLPSGGYGYATLYGVRLGIDYRAIEVVHLRLEVAPSVEPVVEMSHGFRVGARVQPNTEYGRTYPVGVVQPQDHRNNILLQHQTVTPNGSYTSRWAPYDLELVVDEVPQYAHGYLIGSHVNPREGFDHNYAGTVIGVSESFVHIRTDSGYTSPGNPEGTTRLLPSEILERPTEGVVIGVDTGAGNDETVTALVETPITDPAMLGFPVGSIVVVSGTTSEFGSVVIGMQGSEILIRYDDNSEGNWLPSELIAVENPSESLRQLSQAVIDGTWTPEWEPVVEDRGLLLPPIDEEYPSTQEEAEIMNDMAQAMRNAAWVDNSLVETQLVAPATEDEDVQF